MTTYFVCGDKQQYAIAFMNGKLDEENSVTKDNTPAVVVLNDSYVTIENDVVTDFKDAAAKKLVIETVLGYNSNYTATVANGKVTVKEAAETKATFDIRANSDFSKNVVCVVPDTDTAVVAITPVTPAP